MKIYELSLLLDAAELGIKHLSESSRRLVLAAISSAYLEMQKREKLQKLVRPARTVTRSLIRAELRQHYHRVRLTQSGEWHVQRKPGMPWLLFALNDNDAQEELLMMERVRTVLQDCGCVTPHSDAAGVVEACLAGKREAALEMDGGWI